MTIQKKCDFVKVYLVSTWRRKKPPEPLKTLEHKENIGLQILYYVYGVLKK